MPIHYTGSWYTHMNTPFTTLGHDIHTWITHSLHWTMIYTHVYPTPFTTLHHDIHTWIPRSLHWIMICTHEYPVHYTGPWYSQGSIHQHCWFQKNMSVYRICQYIEIHNLLCNAILIHFWLCIKRYCKITITPPDLIITAKKYKKYI